MGAGTGEVGGLHNHVTSNPEREPSVLCHGCWGTPPFALNFPVSLPPRLSHPPFLSPLLYCCGCVFGFQLLTLGWIQSLLPSCLCAMLHYKKSNPRLNISICTFTRLLHHVFSHCCTFFITFFFLPFIYLLLMTVHLQLLTDSSMSALAHLI